MRDYFLKPREKDDKSGFFMRFGFNLPRWQVLQEALREHGRSQPVTLTVEYPFAVRYNVEGPLKSPDGRWPLLRSI